MLKLYSNQLAAQLQKSLTSVYLVFGEEPLQKQESIDLIRAAAKNTALKNGKVTAGTLVSAGTTF